MTVHTPITVAYGDGIGPEIMEAVLTILRYAKAAISIETIEIGEKIYKRGFTSGISPDTWTHLKRNKILLKAPITTPQGGGYKSLNVTLRGALGLYANVRPSVAYHPFIATNHPGLDLVIIRENGEDLYTGIEYRQTHNMYESLKLVSRTGCERIIRYAFEYAIRNNRKKVSCFSKDNIMKMSDGIFHKVFDEVAKDYTGIETDHYIIDIGSARIACRPEIFDVVVTSNLYGDIISDIAAEISGSVGLAGSANIGDDYAMFEAIHGSAPDIAGQDMANPSGLLHAAIMMLVHIGQPKVAETIHNAWLRTLEDGIHTGDIYTPSISREKVGTQAFASAVIKRLGELPQHMEPKQYVETPALIKSARLHINTKEVKQLVGVDIFIHWQYPEVEQLASRVNELAKGELKLQLITLLGLKVWPDPNPAPAHGDHWRLRFVPGNTHKTTDHKHIIFLLSQFEEAGFDVIKTENLYIFDDALGFSLAQGE
jgi:isocitrate dehydrogenase